MPKYFKTPLQCPDLEVLADLDSVIAAHERFTPIQRFGLTVDVILAFADDDKPALTKNGAHPDGYIKRGDKDARAEGRGDVKIYVDAAKYQRKTIKQRMGFWAHELYHVEMLTHRETTVDDDGREIFVDAPDLDDYGRPKFTLIPDDINITGFIEVAEWYGGDSGEVQSYHAMGKMLAQALLPFMAGDDRGGAPDFSKPGPRITGRFNADGELCCGRCGCGDLGAVDRGDPLCNGCNATVVYPPKAQPSPDQPLSATSAQGRPLATVGDLAGAVAGVVERGRSG